MIKSEKFLTCKNIIISAKLMKKMTRKRQKISENVCNILQHFATIYITGILYLMHLIYL